MQRRSSPSPCPMLISCRTSSCILLDGEVRRSGYRSVPRCDVIGLFSAAIKYLSLVRVEWRPAPGAGRFPVEWPPVRVPTAPVSARARTRRVGLVTRPCLRCSSPAGRSPYLDAARALTVRAPAVHCAGSGPFPGYGDRPVPRHLHRPVRRAPPMPRWYCGSDPISMPFRRVSSDRTTAAPAP